MGLECAKVSYSAVLAFLIWLDGAAPYWRNDCHWKEREVGWCSTVGARLPLQIQIYVIGAPLLLTVG